MRKFLDLLSNGPGQGQEGWHSFGSGQCHLAQSHDCFIEDLVHAVNWFGSSGRRKLVRLNSLMHDSFSTQDHASGNPEGSNLFKAGFGWNHFCIGATSINNILRPTTTQVLLQRSPSNTKLAYRLSPLLKRCVSQ